MIIKPHEIEKLNLTKNKFFLFYGENQGYKNQIIDSNFKKIFLKNTYIFEEAEILVNVDSFFDKILSQSFFEKEKLFIINRATDKIKTILEEVIDKDIEDLVIVLNSNSLEKKSKIRSLFEKNKKTVCVAFYEDNSQTLSTIVNNFFRTNKISISQQTINLIVQRARGDRLNLNNELEKIRYYTLSKKKIEAKDILKLTNLAENYNVFELIDSCLSKNKKKTVNILNENNYSLEDCILIIRTFLIKSKKLIKLSKELKQTKNVDLTISSSKPPIFWKEKETIKQQLNIWTYSEIEKLIYRINNIELLIKQHNNNSIAILFNFIIETAAPINN